MGKATVEPEYIALSINGNQTEFDTQSEVEDFLFNHIMDCLEDVNSDTDAYREYLGILGKDGEEEAGTIWNVAQDMVYCGWSHLDEGNPDDNGNLIYSTEITNDIEERAIGQIFYIEVYKDEYNGGMRKSSTPDIDMQSEFPDIGYGPIEWKFEYVVDGHDRIKYYDTVFEAGGHKFWICIFTHDGLVEYMLRADNEGYPIESDCDGPNDMAEGIRYFMQNIKREIEDFIDSNPVQAQPEQTGPLHWDSPTFSEGPSGQTIRTSTAEINRNSTTYILSACEESDDTGVVMCWAKVFDAIRNECVAGDLTQTFEEAKDKCLVLLERYLDNPEVQYGASVHKFIIGKSLARMSSLININKSSELSADIDNALAGLFPSGNLYDIRELSDGMMAIYFGPLFDTRYIANELRNGYGMDARAVGYEVSVSRNGYSASTRKSLKKYVDFDKVSDLGNKLCQSDDPTVQMLGEQISDATSEEELSEYLMGAEGLEMDGRDKKVFDRLNRMLYGSDYSASTRKSIRKTDHYRGLTDVEFIWHGSQADPELRYKDKLVNYYDIDNAIYLDFKEDHPEYEGKDIPDDVFNEYVMAHDYLVYEYLDSAIADKSARKSFNGILRQRIESVRKSEGADADTILSWIRSLAQSQGFYGRLLRDIDENPDILQELVDQDFKDSLEMVLYIEG